MLQGLTERSIRKWGGVSIFFFFFFLIINGWDLWESRKVGAPTPNFVRLDIIQSWSLGGSCEQSSALALRICRVVLRRQKDTLILSSKHEQFAWGCKTIFKPRHNLHVLVLFCSRGGQFGRASVNYRYSNINKVALCSYERRRVQLLLGDWAYRVLETNFRCWFAVLIGITLWRRSWHKINASSIRKSYLKSPGYVSAIWLVGVCVNVSCLTRDEALLQFAVCVVGVVP